MLRILILTFLLLSDSSAISAEDAVAFERTKYISLVGGTADATATLRISGASISAPLSWSVTISSGTTSTLFFVSHEDSAIDQFYADPGYVVACSDYLSCKKKWYFEDLPEAVFAGIDVSLAPEGAKEQWRLERLRSEASAFLSAKGLSQPKLSSVLKEMEQLLAKRYSQVALPESAVSQGPSYMYVPSLGYYVPYWRN